MPHARKKIAKKATPSAMRAPRPTGLSGVKLLDVARIDRAVDVGHRLDDADLEQDLAGFLQESLQLAGEEFLVRGLVLPAQVPGRGCELLGALLHVGAHDLVRLLRVARDHLERLEVALRHRARGAAVFGEVLRRAAEGVHYYRVVEGR